MNVAELSIRFDQGAMLDMLERAGATIRDPKSFRCPFHRDRRPSAGIYRDGEGAWRFKCHSCGVAGDVLDIQARIEGKDLADVIREHKPAGDRPKASGPVKIERSKAPARVYATLEELERAALRASADRLNTPRLAARSVYTNPDTGRPDLVVLRVEGDGEAKTFLQARPEGDGFVFGKPAGPAPLYNRTRLRTADQVVVVEGEKCVHALQGLGIVATTAPGGAGKAAFADWSPLAGKKIYLWPDNDPADPKTGRRTGIEHMREVAALLERLDPAPRLFWIDSHLLGLPSKGDAADFIAQYSSEGPETVAGYIREILRDAEPMGASREVAGRFEAIVAGEWEAILWPWHALGRVTQALLPGTVTLLCGVAGGSKSLFMLDALAFWREQGVKAALFALEEDRAFHLQRALAQAEGLAGLTNAAWVRANSARAREAAARHADLLDDLGRCIWDAPDVEVTHEMLLKWTGERAAAGARVLLVDPVTLAVATDKPWISDARFMTAVKAIARRYACSILLVSHPRKGAKGVGLDDMAGGAAFARFSQTALWLGFHPDPVEVLIRHEALTFKDKINREIFVVKARNGVGTGARIGFRFDPATLRFQELGLIAREK